MVSTTDDETYLVVGIDFGTTYSGVAWALSTRPKDIDVITEWDSEYEHNTDSAKVATKISYSRDGTVTSWGFDHDIDDIQISRFKLILCEEAKKQLDKQSLEVMEAGMMSAGKKPLDVAADYLHNLWEHVTQVLKNRLGPTLFENLPIKIVLTIPAIWDHQAQDLTKKAAEKAGITRKEETTFELVSEPEAAARYVFSEDLSLKVGDVFVVCDAGGGTIDLISYQVERLHPLRLKMCSEATGDLFGAVFLDTAFENYVESMIGSDVFNAIPRRNKRKILSDWEYGMKRNFKHGHRADKGWFIDIPGLSRHTDSAWVSVDPPAYRADSPLSTSSSATLGREMPRQSTKSTGNAWGEADNLRLTTSDLDKIFGKVCPRIVELVDAQVKAVQKSSSKIPKAIFLVGGFGASKYLKEELKTSFTGIEIRQPKDSWSAICRGAVLKGMNDAMITNFISRYHYGVNFREPFVQGRHCDEDKEWDSRELKWKAKRQMRWYIAKGENVPKNTSVTHDWYRTYASKEDFTSFTDEIYYCRDIVAPRRRNLHVMKLCELTATFDSNVWNELPVYKNSAGKSYRKLIYESQMRVTASGLKWACRYKGQVRGNVTITMDMHHEGESEGESDN